MNQTIAKLVLKLNYPGPISRLKTYDHRTLIADRRGMIVRLNLDNSLTTLLDIRDQVEMQEIAGFLNFAFAPWFELDPSVYVWYSTKLDPYDVIHEESLYTRISVFKVDPVTLLVNKDSEVILLSIHLPAGGHVGGELRFLADNTLLIGTGEGGHNEQTGEDYPLFEPQEDDSLIGKLLRYIVVYPLINYGGGYDPSILRPAINNLKPNSPIFAKGFRNPYATTEVTTNPRNPAVISYQNGDNNWEMITHVEATDNLGWPCFEAFEKTNFFLDRCEFVVENLKTPFLVYPRGSPSSPDRIRPWVKIGTSISPGFIYHGSEFPSWSNAIIFGDLTNQLFYAKSSSTNKFGGAYAMEYLPVDLSAIPSTELLTFVDAGPDEEPLVTTYNFVSEESSIYDIKKEFIG